MKRFILTLTIAALLAPGLSFAQDSTQPEPQKTNKVRLFKAGGIGLRCFGEQLALLALFDEFFGCHGSSQALEKDLSQGAFAPQLPVGLANVGDRRNRDGVIAPAALVIDRGVLKRAALCQLNDRHLAHGGVRTAEADRQLFFAGLQQRGQLVQRGSGLGAHRLHVSGRVTDDQLVQGFGLAVLGFDGLGMHLSIQASCLGFGFQFAELLELGLIGRNASDNRPSSAHRQGLVFLAGQQGDACTGSAAKTTAPTDAEKLVSDATKENLKTAGRLAASFGKALADKTKQAAAVAAEKGREAQEALARRAEEAKARKEAEAAENARLEAERAQALVEQEATAQPEPRVVEPEPVQTDSAPEAPEPVVEEVVPEPTPEPEAGPAPVIKEPVSAPAPAVNEAVDATPAAPAPVERVVPSVPASAPSKPAQAPVAAPKATATRAPVKPEAPKASPAKPSGEAAAKDSNKKGWQLLAGSGVAVLVLGGALAWWTTHRSSETVPLQDKPAAAVTAPAPVTVPVAPVVSAPPQVEEPKPVTAPVEEKAAVAAPVVEAPVLAEPPKAQTPATAPASKPVPVSKPAAKPKPAPKPVAKPEPKNDWQDQANSDIDAWAEKIR
ncbi:TPA: hypothetical protein UMY98_000037 [Stenotrophomonas maltophilia]|nr:hypothetical protein [Stenotrophomonas maltophilia]